MAHWACRQLGVTWCLCRKKITSSQWSDSDNHQCFSSHLCAGCHTWVVEITFLKQILVWSLNDIPINVQVSVQKQNWAALIRHLIILSKLLFLRLLSTDCVTVQYPLTNHGIGPDFKSCYPSMLESNSKEVKKKKKALLLVGKCNHVGETFSQMCWQDIALSIINWISVCPFFLTSPKMDKTVSVL